MRKWLVLFPILLAPFAAGAFTFAAPGDDGWVTNEAVAAVHMNQIDTEFDALEAARNAILTVDSCTSPPCDLTAGTTIGGVAPLFAPLTGAVTTSGSVATVTLLPSSLTSGGGLYGGGAANITALAVQTNGQLPIGDGSGAPTLGTLSGVANETDITNGAGTITVGIVDPLIVSKGGTGSASLTSGGLLTGAGTGAISPLAVQTNGQLPIGDGSGAPTLATLTGTASQISVTNGAGSITLALLTPLISVGTGNPGNCAVGDYYSQTATTLRNCICIATNSWQCSTATVFP